MKGILLDEAGELSANNGALKFGDTTTQEVDLLLTLNQGEVKSDPILGPSLVKMIRGGVSQSKIRTTVRTHLVRDGKNYDEIKQMLSINT